MSNVMNVTVETQVDVNILEVWEMLWGCDGAGFNYWVGKVRQLDGEGISVWVKNEQGDLVGNPQGFTVYDGESDEWHTVTLEKLAKGYAQARAEGVTHCGGCALDDGDACVEDILMQYAIFGEMVYG